MDQVPNIPPDTLKSALLLLAFVATIVGGLWQGFRWLRGQISEVVKMQVVEIQIYVKALIEDSVKVAIVSHERVEQEWRNDLKEQIVETNRRIDGMLTEVLTLAREIIHSHQRG